MARNLPETILPSGRKRRIFSLYSATSTRVRTPSRLPVSGTAILAFQLGPRGGIDVPGVNQDRLRRRVRAGKPTRTVFDAGCFPADDFAELLDGVKDAQAGGKFRPETGTPRMTLSNRFSTSRDMNSLVPPSTGHGSTSSPNSPGMTKLPSSNGSIWSLASWATGCPTTEGRGMALVHAVDRLEGAVVEEPLSPVQGVVQHRGGDSPSVIRGKDARRQPRRRGGGSRWTEYPPGRPNLGVGLRPSGTKINVPGPRHLPHRSSLLLRYLKPKQQRSRAFGRGFVVGPIHRAAIAQRLWGRHSRRGIVPEKLAAAEHVDYLVKRFGLLVGRVQAQHPVVATQRVSMTANANMAIPTCLRRRHQIAVRILPGAAPRCSRYRTLFPPLCGDEKSGRTVRNPAITSPSHATNFSRFAGALPSHHLLTSHPAQPGAAPAPSACS